MTRVTALSDWEPLVHGAAALEPGTYGGAVPHRLPAWARAQIDDALFAFAEACPGGVSLRFETDATLVRLSIAARVVTAVGSDAAPVVLRVRRGAVTTEVLVSAPTIILLGPEQQVVETRSQPPQVLGVPLAGEGAVEVLLPHNAHVELVALEADGAVRAHEGTGTRWTHYGSSISQGMNALTVTRTWPVAAAERLGWRLRNLSLAGNAQLDGFAARVIRDSRADLITLKIGINLLNADSMRERTFRSAAHAFLDTIREGQPDTPIILITALACPIHEYNPGPVVMGADGMARVAVGQIEQDTGALTLARSREILEDIANRRGDPMLAVLDGRMLLGESDTRSLYDGLHPDQHGLDLIAARFVAAVPGIIEGFQR